jgi:hypothetical protein
MDVLLLNKGLSLLSLNSEMWEDKDEDEELRRPHLPSEWRSESSFFADWRSIVSSTFQDDVDGLRYAKSFHLQENRSL